MYPDFRAVPFCSLGIMTDMKNIPEVIRLVHMADLHLGSAFSSFPEQAECLRDESFNAFLSIVEHCEKEHVHLLLIAGDLFDLPEAPPGLASRVAIALGSLTATRVFISAGNHDPAGLLSPYRTLAWPSHVKIFAGAPESVQIPELGICVHGAGFESAISTEPLFDPDFTSQELEDGNIHILVLHGDLLESAVPSLYNPIQKGWLTRAGFGFAAFGHRHEAVWENLPGGAFAYCGCLTGRGFDELGPKGALDVTLGRRHSPVRTSVPLVSVSCLQTAPPARMFLELAVDVSTCETADGCADRVKKAMMESGGGEWPRNLYRIALIGEREEEMPVPLDRIRMRLDPVVFYIRIEDRTRIRENLDELARQHSLRGAFVRIMRTKIAAAQGDEAVVRQLETALRTGLQAARGEVSSSAVD